MSKRAFRLLIRLLVSLSPEESIELICMAGFLKMSPLFWEF